MSSFHFKGASCPNASIILNIIDGGAWTARRISNNMLRQHCRLLARTFREPPAITVRLRDECRRLLEVIGERSHLLTQVHPSQFPVIPVLVRIAAYSERWIRAPEQWPGSLLDSPREVIRSLVEHLFTRWPMPAWFDSAWQVKGTLKWLERDWYCAVGSGAGLRALPGMPPSITSRALHLSQEAPDSLSIREALRWGQIKACGGSDELLAEVLSSRMVKDLSNDTIWSRLLGKVIAARDFEPGSFGMIADTLLELMATDDFRRAGWLLDLPIAHLLRHCERYWRAQFQSAAVNFADWKGTDIRCPNLRMEIIHRTGMRWRPLIGSQPSIVRMCEQEWRIEELANQWQLTAEGRAMRHCVGAYGKSCRIGENAIFSLRRDEVLDGRTIPKSHLTIQVSREAQKVVQIRGKWNACPSPEQIPVLRKWAAVHDLVC